jgi:hypothetical protein
MAGQFSQPVSDLLAKWQGSDEEALRALLPLVYNKLRCLAHHYLKADRSGHTLQSAALVGVFPATVKREWSSARAWLHREIKRCRQT